MIRWSLYYEFAAAIEMWPSEMKKMSLWELRTFRSKWIKTHSSSEDANSTSPSSKAPSLAQMDELVAKYGVGGTHAPPQV